jgi:hypothetical protein
MRLSRDATDRARPQMFSAYAHLRSIVQLAAVALILASAVFTTTQAEEIPDGVTDYANALTNFQKSKGRQSIQPIFEAGLETSSHLQAVLLSLSESDYQKAQREMAGFVVVRHPNQSSLVRPSVDYFRTLARKKGTKADRDFFEIYARTEPDGNGPFSAYIKGRDGESGCTIFAGKKITELYRGWLTFRTTYPDAYAAEAQGETDGIETELQSGICSCDSADQTVAGLQTFVDAFPNLPITPKIKARIADIRGGKSSFRFNCKG